YHQTNQKTNTGKTLKPWPILVDHYNKQSGWSFNKQHRVFQEDIVYGLSLLVHLGEHLNIPLPYTNEIYTWCMGYLGLDPNIPHPAFSELNLTQYQVS
ncbi:NAD/NADP octopine/nopaline dehydrogenase family protein, partial [Providencia rettgeri]